MTHVHEYTVEVQDAGAVGGWSRHPWALWCEKRADANGALKLIRMNEIPLRLVGVGLRVARRVVR